MIYPRFSSNQYGLLYKLFQLTSYIAIFVELVYRSNFDQSYHQKSPKCYVTVPFGIHLVSVIQFLKRILSISNVEIIKTFACYFVNNATFLIFVSVCTYTIHFFSKTPNDDQLYLLQFQK